MPDHPGGMHPGLSALVPGTMPGRPWFYPLAPEHPRIIEKISTRSPSEKSQPTLRRRGVRVFSSSSPKIVHASIAGSRCYSHRPERRVQTRFHRPPKDGQNFQWFSVMHTLMTKARLLYFRIGRDFHDILPNFLVFCLRHRNYFFNTYYKCMLNHCLEWVLHELIPLQTVF